MKKILLASIKYFSFFIVTVSLATIAVPGVFILAVGLPLILFMALVPMVILAGYASLYGAAKIAKLKVLVIDNDQEFLAEVSKKLKSEKWSTEALSNPSQAIGTILNAKKYNLIMIRRKISNLSDQISDQDFSELLKQAIERYNTKFSTGSESTPVDIPLVIFFSPPKKPILKFLLYNMTFVFDRVEVATPDEFKSTLSAS